MGAILAAVVLATCSTQSMPGTLDLRARKSRIVNDGEATEISFVATDGAGKIGTGSVTFQVTNGVIDSPVAIDSFGTGITTFSCDGLQDPGCKGPITITARWKDVTAELTIRVAERCPGGTLCNGVCAATSADWFNCGDCGVQCNPDQACIGGACGPCPGGDCDSDGWLPNQGDCCDQYNVCSKPASVNPGAIEALGNGLDDNCNGLLDAADTIDVQPCDEGLGPRHSTTIDYARAMGLCRMAVEDAPLPQRTWGVIAAQLMLVDGDGGVAPNSTSIRPVFGVIPPQEGTKLVVLSTNVASDRVQTNPSLADGHVSSRADMQACTAPLCIKDWFGATGVNKAANKLPDSPKCAGASGQNVANDSVMLYLKIRAPTNAKSFRIKSRFFSQEYPEFVCSAFNDQVVLLINAPGAFGNPSDKNLMMYSADAGVWPVGVNLATGTPLFQTCVPKAANPMCWDTSVDEKSCNLGPGDLANTQFGGMPCPSGGATRWLTTAGNVVPGRVFELRAAVWNVSDGALDSLVLLDDFEWGVDPADAGTGDD